LARHAQLAHLGSAIVFLHSQELISSSLYHPAEQISRQLLKKRISHKKFHR
jgi:hypothetical protein